ncbi:hypothetical protein [Nitrincola sp. MINF-07-Sa-05]|uniref:hypothetical protein n=1 Tax=Nitrincola salilacus TaxID=3400273 RepID=UPI00391817F9
MDISSALSSFSNLGANIGVAANPTGANADQASTNRNEPSTSSAVAQGRAEAGIQVNISSAAQEALQQELNGQRVGNVSQTELTYNNAGQLGNNPVAAGPSDNAGAQASPQPASDADDIRSSALDNLTLGLGAGEPQQTSALENSEREAVESIGGEVF